MSSRRTFLKVDEAGARHPQPPPDPEAHDGKAESGDGKNSGNRKKAVSATEIARLKELFWIFFKISAVTVGGGLTMLPLMTSEFVEKRQWVTDEDMVDTVAVVQSMPGIIAVNMAVLIGYRVAGIAGVLTASFAVVIPPFVTILIVALGIRHLTGSETMDHIFLGVRSAVCALILLSVIKLSGKTLKGWFPILVAAAGFVSLVFFSVNAIWLIVWAAAAGLLYYFLVLFLSRKKIAGALRSRKPGGGSPE